MTSATSKLTLGPYELVRRLGAGGMAETFFAVRKGPAGFRQDVCLKRVLPSLVEDVQFVELFLEEARIQSRVRHGNIVQVYDFGEADGAYYLALELVDGVDLNALLTHIETRGQRLSIAIALLVLRELCRALDVAHNLVIDGVRQNVVHRDISPSNILLSVTGEVKLTDFGIAISQNREYKTQTGHARGKLGYMAPEQVQGGSVDARSDLFSLGVVLYLLLTGEQPFRGAGMSDYDVLSRVVHGEYTPLRQLNSELPAELAALIEAMLAVDPGNRPKSAREVLERTASLLPPLDADRELATLVRAVQQADEAADEAALAARSSRRITVRGPAPDDATRVREPRESTVRLEPGAQADEASFQTPLSASVPLTLPTGVRVGPSRRAWRVLAAASVVLLLCLVGALAVRGAHRNRESSSSRDTSQHAQGGEGAPTLSGAASSTKLATLESPAQLTAPATAPLAATNQLESPAAKPSSKATAAASAPAATGILRVLVSPYGEVRIDGELVGEAPISKRVTAGAHTVEAGSKDAASTKTKATVIGGQTKVVRIRLAE